MKYLHSNKLTLSVLVLSAVVCLLFPERLHGTETEKSLVPAGDSANLCEQMAQMRRLVHTSDEQMNRIAESIFFQCIFFRQFDPLPPALPNKWFSAGGGYVGQWVWDKQFVLAGYAPIGEESVIRGVYDNYWQTINNLR